MGLGPQHLSHVPVASASHEFCWLYVHVSDQSLPDGCSIVKASLGCRHFQGNMYPLASHSILETCTLLSMLPYGSENWILTGSLLQKLEVFQGKIVKRILKWPNYICIMTMT